MASILLDRTTERARIDDLLDVARRGMSAVLVLRGDDGVGKTTLVDYAIETARDFRVSAIAGIESEINLPYGAVHQLLIPFLPLIDDLPAPQRQALQVAFGLLAGPPPEPFLVGLACLTLLSRAAADQPVFCTVDDAHWIDPESALVLGFVARRLYADRVGVLLTVADTGMQAGFQRLPALEVRGLPRDAAAELLSTVTSAPLEPAVVDRVLADTECNPLALADIGSQYTAEELADRAYMPHPIPTGGHLQQRYLRRVDRLPADAQEFLLLVAADVSCDRGRVRQAAAAAGIDADAAESAAEEAGLIEASSNCTRFRYPLIRAAIYHGASDAGRRRAHHWLAQASSGQGDSGEQIWHSAAAAAGPDEQLAAELAAAAGRTRERGAWSATATLLRRSIALTPDPGIRAPREVALANAELAIGHPHTAQDVARDALPRLTDDSSRGEASLVIGDALFAQGSDLEATEALADAAAALSGNPSASADALLAALNAAIWAGPAEVRKIAMIPPPPPSDAEPGIADLLLAGYRARFTKGYSASVAPLRAALKALRADDLEPVSARRWFLRGTVAAASLWHDQAMLDISERWVAVTRRLGALPELPIALAFLAITACLVGRLEKAADCWTEMRELIAASQISPMFGMDSGGQGLLLTARGQLARARAAAIAQIRESTARGQNPQALMGKSVLALAELRAGQCEAAVDTALSVIREDPAFTAETTLPTLIEAAIRSDQQDVARSAFATLAERTTAAGTPWAHGLRARCQALLEEGDAAEDAYRESIRQLGRSRATLDLARAHLMYGQWLRRAKRRRDARRQLRTAEDMFHAMGAAGFAEEASSELRATGERARKRSPETEFELTPQEGRVAHLAANGSTNSEIAEQLFISPSTVDYHLGKVFRKLGVTARAQLAHHLPGPA